VSARTLVLVMLGVAATIALLLHDIDDDDRDELAAPIGSGEPDLYMHDAVISQFQDDGSLRYDLKSKQIRHFQSHELTQLEAPDLHMRQTENPPWTARADYGEIRLEPAADQSPPEAQRHEVVHLRHHVHLEQTRGERFISLTSDELYVYPERQYAETDQAVMIDSNAGRTKAVGLSADLNRSVLNLQSDENQRVHTIVLPHQFKP
jgi:lipopolysaccharide export system protein LptC